MYSSLNIAASMITWCASRSIPIQNGKLNDLLFLLNNAFVKDLGYPCINDTFEFWQGPVSLKVHHRYRIYGDTSISRPRDHEAILSQKEWKLFTQIMNKSASKSELRLNEIAKAEAGSERKEFK